MAKFLNTDLLNEWIPRLIEETERELVIIVPYVKTSERIYKYLKDADSRGVETTLIYRENQLNEKEKHKLKELHNLNLMHHPNVHAKCYYNERYLIIGSMNLYEYSELNNREMGVLLHRIDLDDETSKWHGGSDSDFLFEEAIREIQQIRNGSHMEKKSRETIQEGFEMEILKTMQEKEEEWCRELNRVFLHKRFEVANDGNDWVSICRNYFDKVDVIIGRRTEIVFTRGQDYANALYERAKPTYNEFQFPGFKFYWNPYYCMCTLYINSKDKRWEQMNERQQLEYHKKVLDDVILHLRRFM